MLTTFCQLIWIMTQSKCQLFNVCDEVQKQIFIKKSCWSNECHTPSFFCTSYFPINCLLYKLHYGQ